MLLILVLVVLGVYKELLNENKRIKELELIAKKEWLKHKVEYKRNQFELYKKHIERTQFDEPTYEEGLTWLINSHRLEGKEELIEDNVFLSLDIKSALSRFTVDDIILAFY